MSGTQRYGGPVHVINIASGGGGEAFGTLPKYHRLRFHVGGDMRPFNGADHPV